MKDVYLKTATCSRCISGPSVEVDRVVAQYVAMGEVVVHEEVLLCMV